MFRFTCCRHSDSKSLASDLKTPRSPGEPSVERGGIPNKAGREGAFNGSGSG